MLAITGIGRGMARDRSLIKNHQGVLFDSHKRMTTVEGNTLLENIAEISTNVFPEVF